MTVTAADIQAAARQIEGHVERTPTVPATGLDDLVSAARLVLKLENLQVSGSFKARGALVRLLALAPDEAGRGVVAMSAGNHAQGVAWHARRLGIPATIVMPAATPFTKVERTETLGARVVLHGEGLAESEAHARDLERAEGLTFVHPYDDPHIIAGQGTVALELLADGGELDTLVVPVGGGGLIAGMAVAARTLVPAIRIVGVQAEGYATMARRPAASPRQPARSPQNMALQTLAEGIAVKRPGLLTRPLVDALVDDVLCVDEAAIERAVAVLMERRKIVAEGAGAAALAAMLAHPDAFAGRRVGIVVSGGNIDSRLLASVLMRGLVRAGRLARLRIEISDAPGTLAKVATLIGAQGGNILEVSHQRLFQDVPVKHAELDVVVEAVDPAHIRAMVEALGAAGYPARLLGTSAALGE
ncbi:threonine ammonia-lyase [Magnetospirillum sp. UT-4]|uniref:threonine ammonia-lyase n=1 Tax=Magnetospirillum sp. UT-4 TaxID=2681467 RepID=UPI001380BD31|nr:threonine ammonia-lyase [Magnetospirillum sp. UT-4]CAA7617733.1 putative Threonine dehydratase [Magnetospirillum sp. UT-4]